MSEMPTYEQALQFMTDVVLYQRIDLTGPWSGWKIRGQYLVSPEKERIMMRELIGLLIHYRRKFRHHHAAAKSAVPTESNVVSIMRAADVSEQPKKAVA